MSLLGIFGTIGRSAILLATTHRAERTVDLVNALFANMADDKKEPEEEEEDMDFDLFGLRHWDVGGHVPGGLGDLALRGPDT